MVLQFPIAMPIRGAFVVHEKKTSRKSSWHASELADPVFLE
jgi:hypothetical protein